MASLCEVRVDHPGSGIVVFELLREHDMATAPELEGALRTRWTRLAGSWSICPMPSSSTLP
jgi:hypothetical protein